jgi:phospholipid/cholesterol/gamma-HCH transport system substrate-binding protein
MRRIALTIVAVALLAALVLATSAASQGDGDGSYKVRAIFDNGGFIVPGEDVRIAGANVGSVESVDVSMPGDVVSLEGGPHAIPGKAVVVLDIADEGFQDFRADASCLIRPQSLIGEKFVDCRPTVPRAPGSEPPPPLEQIEDGEAGEGQYLLPLENNGKSVDIDLINNIMRRPYAERFRLILNDLGAGLAARGDELREIVERANPALRETDEVLAILAAQNRELAQLTADSDVILAPLARERGSLSGFIRSSAATAAATAERGAELEQNLNKLPPTLREIRLTMNELGNFSDAAFPVFKVFGDNAASITAATRQLGPFADASAFALKDLGDVAEQAGPKLRDADPVVRQIRDLARRAARPSTNLNRLTSSLRRTGGFEDLMSFLYNTTGAFNGFDRFGHYQRTNILVSGCIQYQTFPLSGCVANFTGPGTAVGRDMSSRAAMREVFGEPGSDSGGTRAPTDGAIVPGVGDALQTGPAEQPAPDPGTPRTGLGAGVDVLEYLLGP